MKNSAYCVIAVLFLVAFVTTFNYGGCVDSGGSSSGTTGGGSSNGAIDEPINTPNQPIPTTSGDAETVSTPAQPTGATSVRGASFLFYLYSTSGSISNLGHSLQYRFDWGDGTSSDWSSSTTRVENSWYGTELGTYIVRVQARCATHTSVVSTWSPGLLVSVIISD